MSNINAYQTSIEQLQAFKSALTNGASEIANTRVTKMIKGWKMKHLYLLIMGKDIVVYNIGNLKNDKEKETIKEKIADSLKTCRKGVINTFVNNKKVTLNWSIELW